MSMIKRRIALLLMAVLVVIMTIPLTAMAAPASITTDLVDGLVTKSDRLTFDVWAKDEANRKIDGSLLQVTNNETLVPINWDDTEKTSYTLHLELGENHIKIQYGEQAVVYTLTRLAAEDGEVIGHFTFSLDAFSVGMGYLIEPIQVPIIKGRTAAEELHAILTDHGFTYTFTGMLKNNFYLASINKPTLYDRKPVIPEKVKLALQGVYDEQDYSRATGLGEFDINYMSGWMYAVNNVFPNVGFSDKFLLDGDVMRVQYTLAYGQDIGGGEALGDGLGADYFEPLNKDMLTKKLALIHATGKEAFLINEARINAYNNALDVLKSFGISQRVLHEALVQLEAAEQQTISDGTVPTEPELEPQPEAPVEEDGQQTAEKENIARVQSQIAVLPATITFEQQFAVESARVAYEQLSSASQQLVTNYARLVAAEQTLAHLIEQFIAKVATLETTITLAHAEVITYVREQYDTLSATQQAAISNYALLLQAEQALQQLQNIEKVNQAIKQIQQPITLAQQEAIEQARTLYNALTAEQQQQVQRYPQLAEAEEMLQTLQKKHEAVVKVKELIDALPASISEEHRSYVMKIVEAYEALTAEQQALVTNYETLAKAQQILQQLEQLNTIHGNEAHIAVNNEAMTLTIDATSFETLLMREDIDTIVLRYQNGMALRIAKETLTTVLAAHHTVTMDVELISLGQQQLLTVTTNDALLTIPVTLVVPTTVWQGGHLIEQDGQTYKAVRHHQNEDALTASIETNTAYSYTDQIVTFSDIETHYSRGEIEYLASRYVIQGNNGLFSPHANITRAQFAAMIARALGVTPTTPTSFTDIQGKWFEADVQALQEIGIINGVTATEFRPNAPLTRQHAAIMMARVLRYAQVEQQIDTSTVYKDEAAINPQYATDIQWLASLNIMSGSEGYFKPQSSLKRGQMAKILQRTLTTARLM